MGNNRKYLGVRFPFTAKDNTGFFVDLDYNPYNQIKSDLIHLLFTTKGQRLRNPEFGSGLLNHIFEPNDEKTYSDIKTEIQTAISKFFPGVKLLELTVTNNTGDVHGSSVNLKYEIDEGTFKTYDYIDLQI